METSNRSLSPDALTKISHLSISTRRPIAGVFTGQHKSPHHGASIEFADHKEYVAGDETRHIDWRVYGKADRYYIKRFEKETNIKALIFVDASASMGYASHALTNLDCAAQLAEGLAYIFLKQSDGVGLVTRHSGSVRHIPASAQTTHFSVIMDEFARLPAEGTTDMGAWLQSFNDMVSGAAFCIIISDFFCDMPAAYAALKAIRYRKKETVVFHVLDPYELTFPFSLRTNFKDMELPRELPVEPLTIKRNYMRLFGEYIENFRRTCLEHGIDYRLYDTSVPVEKLLLDFTAGRG